MTIFNDELLLSQLDSVRRGCEATGFWGDVSVLEVAIARLSNLRPFKAEHPTEPGTYLWRKSPGDEPRKVPLVWRHLLVVDDAVGTTPPILGGEWGPRVADV